MTIMDGSDDASHNVPLQELVWFHGGWGGLREMKDLRGNEGIAGAEEGAGPGTADLGDFKDANKDANEGNEGAEEGAGPGNADFRVMKKTRI